MDDLKQALFAQIYEYLKHEVFPVVHTGNTIIDLAVNYIDFANREKKIIQFSVLRRIWWGKGDAKLLL